MKLGRSVVPQVKMSMFGGNLCSTSFAGVMTLEICYNFAASMIYALSGAHVLDMFRNMLCLV